MGHWPRAACGLCSLVNQDNLPAHPSRWEPLRSPSLLVPGVTDLTMVTSGGTVLISCHSKNPIPDCPTHSAVHLKLLNWPSWYLPFGESLSEGCGGQHVGKPARKCSCPGACVRLSTSLWQTCCVPGPVRGAKINRTYSFPAFSVRCGLKPLNIKI